VDSAVKAVSNAMVGLREVEAQVHVLDVLEADSGVLPPAYEAKRRELRASLDNLRLQHRACEAEYATAQQELAVAIEAARLQIEQPPPPLPHLELLAAASPARVPAQQQPPPPPVPGAPPAVDQMMVQALISTQGATAKAMDRLVDVLQAQHLSSGDRARWRRDVPAPPPPGQVIEGTVTQYLLEMEIFLASESVLLEVKTKGWRNINEELLRSWMSHTWAMQTQQSGGARERFLTMTGEEMLQWIQLHHIGDQERDALVNQFRSLKQGKDEAPIWFLARARALVQKGHLIGVARSDRDALIDIKAGGGEKLKKILRKNPPNEGELDLDAYLRKLVEILAADGGISMMEVDRCCQAFGNEIGLPQRFRSGTRHGDTPTHTPMDLDGMAPIHDERRRRDYEGGGYHGGRGRGDGGRFHGRVDGGRGRGRENGGRGRGDGGRGPSSDSPGAGGRQPPQTPPTNQDTRICWQWRAEGRCGRTTCHFNHPEPPSQRPNWRAPSQDRAAGGGTSSQ
jgi:hypothetical protein